MKQTRDKTNIYLHSTNDEPAVETKEYRHWYKMGNLHRDGYPARMWSESKIAEFWRDGEFLISIMESDEVKWNNMWISHKDNDDNL